MPRVHRGPGNLRLVVSRHQTARGLVLENELAAKIVVTVHPSSLLRQPDEESRAREDALFVADLRVAAKAAAK